MLNGFLIVWYYLVEYFGISLSHNDLLLFANILVIAVLMFEISTRLLLIGEIPTLTFALLSALLSGLL